MHVLILLRNLPVKKLRTTDIATIFHKKHQKPRQNNPEGSIVEIYAPIDVSNVAIYDAKTKKASRVGYSFVDGKKVRISKASKTQLD